MSVGIKPFRLDPDEWVEQRWIPEDRAMLRHYIRGPQWENLRNACLWHMIARRVFGIMARQSKNMGK